MSQVPLTATSSSGTMQCPECCLLLVDKLAVLIPCGHVLHHSCAEYLHRAPPAGADESQKPRCPHCAVTIRYTQPVHSSYDEAALAPAQRDVVRAAIRSHAEIEALQREIIAEAANAKKAAAQLQQARANCAGLYHNIVLLKARVDSAFPSVSVASSNHGGGGGGTSSSLAKYLQETSRVPPPQLEHAHTSSDATFTSVRQLQEFVTRGIAEERQLRLRNEELRRAQAAAAKEIDQLREVCKVVKGMSRVDRGVVRPPHGDVIEPTIKRSRTEQQASSSVAVRPLPPLPATSTAAAQPLSVPSTKEAALSRRPSADVIVVLTSDDDDAASSTSGVVVLDTPSGRPPSIQPPQFVRPPGITAPATAGAAVAFVGVVPRFHDIPATRRVQRRLDGG